MRSFSYTSIRAWYIYTISKTKIFRVLLLTQIFEPIWLISTICEITRPMNDVPPARLNIQPLSFPPIYVREARLRGRKPGEPVRFGNQLPRKNCTIRFYARCTPRRWRFRIAPYTARIAAHVRADASIRAMQARARALCDGVGHARESLCVRFS